MAARADDQSEMARESQSPGPLLASLGAGGALLSLWAPWYSFRIPQSVLNGADALAGQAGVLGPFIKQVTQAARVVGPLHLTAWDVFRQADVLLAVVAGVAVIFALLALTGRGTGTGRLIALGGGAIVVVAGYRVISPPGPSGLLHLMWGAYAAVACGVLAIVGGVLTARADERDEPWGAQSGQWVEMPAADPSWAERGSVPPPTT
jgi:hypothetical protein